MFFCLPMYKQIKDVDYVQKMHLKYNNLTLKG